MTTTTVLADLARNVGGDLVKVASIVPPGADVHSFRTTPSHSITIGQAKVIVSNGFGLDNSFDPLLTNNMQAGAVHIVAAQGLNPEALEEMEFPGGQEGDEHGEEGLAEEIDEIVHQAEEGEISAEEALELIGQLLGGHQDEGGAHAAKEHGDEEESLEESLTDIIHEAEGGRLAPESALEELEQLMEQHQIGEHQHEHGLGDPHFWQDPILAIHYVDRIRDGLIEADPANAEIYEKNAAEYTQKLRDLDQEISQVLSQVPSERRHLVTFHDAYGYFARRYGWQVSAFVPSDASEVTPGAIVQVMNRIREEGIPAVFAEPQFSSDVLRQAARDTGVRVGTIRSLPDGFTPTYLEMMRSNARSLAEELR